MKSRGPAAAPGAPPQRLRIVAGTRRGRYIKVPRGAVRPTSEMVREAVFDALGPIVGLAALDLFAGSGALGLESLSRGAAGCVFVEGDRSVAAVLEENIRALGYEAESRVIVAGYERALESLVKTGKRFDLLFVDPPYRILAEVEVRLAPLMLSLLTATGVAVIESAKTSQVTLGLTPVFARNYGDTRITMVIAGTRSLA